MFSRDQLIRIWTPHIGLGFAEQLDAAYSPLRLLIVLFPIGWTVGIIHALSNGPIHTLSGGLNAAFPVALLGILIINLIKLRRVRNAIWRALSNRGFDSATRPSVLSPSRFRSWLADPGVPPEIAAEILSEEGGPKPKSRATDHA